MALAYIAAGVNHFIHPETYMKIMPHWIPWHEELVFISGVLEIVLGALLLFPATRRFAAWGIIVLLIAVFPANIEMMIDYWRADHPQLWMAILRLPVQGLLIWWATAYTGKAETNEAMSKIQKSKVKGQKSKVKIQKHNAQSD